MPGPVPQAGIRPAHDSTHELPLAAWADEARLTDQELIEIAEVALGSAPTLAEVAEAIEFAWSRGLRLPIFEEEHAP